MLKDKMKLMNLQLFAEDDTSDKDTNLGDDDKSKEDNEKTLTQEEVNKLIAQNKAKAKEEAKKALEKEYEGKLQEEIDKAIEKSKLTKDERESYEEKEARLKLEKEAETLLKENEELKAKITMQELKEKATATLKEKGVDPSEHNLKLVLRSDADSTLEAIDLLANSLAEQKKVLSQSGPPKTSGGFSTSVEDNDFNILDEGKITNY